MKLPLSLGCVIDEASGFNISFYLHQSHSFVNRMNHSCPGIEFHHRLQVEWPNRRHCFYLGNIHHLHIHRPEPRGDL